MKKVLFAKLDIKSIDKKKSVKWLQSVPERYWIWDDYRYCYVLPLCTKNAGLKKKDVSNREDISSFYWTSLAPEFIKEYFEKYVFTWTKMKSRILVLKTLPHQKMKIHIDCSPERFYTIQNKFRIVLKGKVNSLYFQTNLGSLHVPEITTPYLMDGSWPHGMNNTSDVIKYTLAFGSPWTQSDYYPGYTPLIYKNTKKDLPLKYEQYFHRKYLNFS